MVDQPNQKQLEDPTSAAPPPPPRLNPKRDEWSEGAVTSLLEAYESKWVLRNRAKLKGQDWEEVAQQVSSRAEGSMKTATQCKNKVESMKKRYRNEVATGKESRWPLFSKLDGLVRCRSSSGVLVVTDENIHSCDQAAGDGTGLEEAPPVAVQEDHAEEGNKLQPPDTDNHSDQNAPSCNSSKKTHERSRKKEKRKRAKEGGWQVAESIQWLAEVILRVEQTRMEAMREVEKIRAETELKKGEMELKRTEILADTQLQIARLFASRYGDS